MKKFLRKSILIFVLIFVFIPSLSGQAVVSTVLPEPYSPDEFPDWARALRRFEVISIGVFPVVLFYTRMSFDLYRYTTNGFESQYLPWPFKNEFSYKPETAVYNEEQKKTAVIAGLLSLAFAGVDALIRWIPRAGDN